MIDRRQLLGAAAATAPAFALPAFAMPRRAAKALILPAFFADLERRLFNYFWELGREDNGLVPDRWPSRSACSIAAVGFALTAYPLGVMRGWIGRAAVRRRTLTTLRFFAQAPQSAADGVTGYRGFFYHFLDMETGARVAKCELSSVDSTLLFLGMLYAGEWFDADHPGAGEQHAEVAGSDGARGGAAVRGAGGGVRGGCGSVLRPTHHERSAAHSRSAAPTASGGRSRTRHCSGTWVSQPMGSGGRSRCVCCRPA